MTRRTRSRALILESLDPRLCLAGGFGSAGIDAGYFDHASAHVSPWHNSARPHDVNQDQRVTPGDALAVVNALNARGARTLSDAEGESTAMIDVDGDSQVTAADCLAIVNELNEVSADAPTVQEPTSEDTSVNETTVDETSIDEETSAEETVGDGTADGGTVDDGTVDDGTVDAPPTVGDDCGHSQRPTVAEVFARSDVSQDGVLTEEELPAEVWERLSAADADGSGGITLDELSAYRPEGGPHGERHGGPGDADVFERFDENGDGLLTEDELPEQAWLRLASVDSDGDGAVSVDELAAIQPTPSARDDFFARLDADGDGSLTQAEVPACLWERLASADTDGDGLVSSEELTTFRPARPSREGSGPDGMGRHSSGRGMPERGGPQSRGTGPGMAVRSGRGGR